MITTLKVNSGGAVISDEVISAKPFQDTTEVKFNLLSGKRLIQTIGDSRKSHEIEFIITADQQPTVDGYASNKTELKLERHGVDHVGIIDGDPDYTQEIGSTNPANAVYRCRIILTGV